MLIISINIFFRYLGTGAVIPDLGQGPGPQHVGGLSFPESGWGLVSTVREGQPVCSAQGIVIVRSELPLVPAVVSDLCATGDHDCEQVCISSPGSYTCACREGFTLNSDGKTCNGEWGGHRLALKRVWRGGDGASATPQETQSSLPAPHL